MTEFVTEIQIPIETEPVTESETETACQHFDIDNDGNHMCDYCGDISSNCVDKEKDHSCDECSARMGEHSDTEGDGDHICDYCEEILTDCLDYNKDLVCDDCLNLCYSKGLFYIKNSDGSGYAVSGIGSCTDVDVIIPETYEGLPIIAINDLAFEDCYRITSITVPTHVDFISPTAFYGCTNLTEIFVVESNLNYKTIDGNLYSKDGKSLIRYATGKKEENFIIPQGVTEIGEYSFCKSPYITNIVIGNDVKIIGSYAFAFSNMLSDITIGNGVEQIGAMAFSETAYFFDRSNWSNNELYIDNCLIMGSAEVYVIKSGTRLIADNACSNDYTIYSVTIPDSVKFIGKNVFYNCSRMTQVKIGNGVEFIGANAFNSCTNLSNITLGKGIKEIGQNAFYGCNLLSSVYYDGDVESWCNITFANDKSNPILNKFYLKNQNGIYMLLKNLLIPETVTEIKNYAFYRCYSITSLIIPNSVISIGCNAFGGCDALTSVEFKNPNGWLVGEQNADASSLLDKSTAAQLLTDIYKDVKWKRTI